MVVVGLVEKKQKKQQERDDGVIEYERQRKVAVHNKQVQGPHVQNVRTHKNVRTFLHLLVRWRHSLVMLANNY